MAAVPLATALAANPEVRSLVVKPCESFEAALQQRSNKTTPAPHIGESPHALGVIYIRVLRRLKYEKFSQRSARRAAAALRSHRPTVDGGSGAQRR